MRRSSFVVLGMAVASAALPGSTGASVTHARAPKVCSKLRGHDLAPARQVRLVKRSNSDDGTDLLGCMLPNGRVRTIASSSDLFTAVTSYRILAVKGPVLALSSDSGSQYGSSESTWVHNLRTNRHYDILSWSAPIDEEPPAEARIDVIEAGVTRTGRAAAALRDGESVSVVGFSPRGSRQVLATAPADQLDAASLQVCCGTASWTQDGVQRTARLP
jgi:hypothetical protein